MCNKKQKQPPYHQCKYFITLMAVTAAVRPFVIYFFADHPWSHIAGFFVVSTLVWVAPFLKLCIDLSLDAAHDIVDSIEGERANVQWSFIMRRLIMLRGDLESFWAVTAVGGPWCLIVFLEVAGAAACAFRFLGGQQQIKWGAYFFLFVISVLVTLWPLAHITDTCSNRSSLSSSITSAATRWYFPKEGQDADLEFQDYNKYQMVLQYLRDNTFGVQLGGVLISKHLLVDFGVKAGVAFPALYRMMVTVRDSGIHV